MSLHWERLVNAINVSILFLNLFQVVAISTSSIHGNIQSTSQPQFKVKE